MAGQGVARQGKAKNWGAYSINAHLTTTNAYDIVV